MEPFRRRDIYHWRMNGSYSLKSVLPVLVPEMTYEDMEISDGEMASQAYFTMGEMSDPAELSCLRKALLEYCRQDTLGLVRLLEKMRAI
jgi:hypothetical protein